MLRRLSLPPDPGPLPEGERLAAVAAIFGPSDELLLIRRAERAGDPWSGHIAFPGGHREPADGSLRAAAEREVMEELGLDLHSGEYLGALGVVAPYTRRGPRSVTVAPFVYHVERWPDYVLSNEVASVQHIAFSRFLAREGRGSFPYSWQGHQVELPSVTLDGAFIWGLTLRMIDELSELIRQGVPEDRG